jgi:hypothetical protein
MVDVQIPRFAAKLAAPAVSFEHLNAKLFVLSQAELQSRYFLTQFAPQSF